jgi:hypothetical protein
MEYLVGSLITLISIYFVGKFFLQEDKKESSMQIRYSQSHIFSIVKPLLQYSNFNKKQRRTQSSEYERKTNIKVIIVDNFAYWIKNNIFYVSSVEDGVIDAESTTTVDTMNMDKVQLDKMLFIMDKLREGLDNDSGSSGD